MSYREELLTFAIEKAVPFLKEQPHVKEYVEEICFLVVGSVATGQCNQFSDVDICMLCKQETLDKISVKTNWNKGRPTEISLEERQVYYYGISIHSVKEKIKQFDDTYLYIYSNAIVVEDNVGLYENVQQLIGSDEIQKERLRKKTDNFTRKRRGMDEAFTHSKDPFARLGIALENLENLLGMIAMADEIQFDKRKRLYQTALAGERGQELRPQIDQLLQLMGTIGIAENTKDVSRFLEIFDDCFARCNR